MYRVVIVDDELIMRKGLRETIEWDSLGLEVSGEASNGIEALELVKSNKPHILITDIKMPEMDGIELTKEIKDLDLKIKIIILSGYNDYVFLKEAIRYGVESYLLKPIDNDELISNLIDSVNNIEKEIFRITQLHQGIELLRSNTLNRLITNAISLREFDEKASFLDISLQANNYLCAVCTAENIDSGAFANDEQLALLALHNICEELASRTGITFIDAKGRIVFLFLGGETDRFYDTVNTVLGNTAAEILEYLGISILMSAGITVSAIGDIWKSYDSAVRCLDYSISAQKSGIIWYDETKPYDSQADYELNDKTLADMGKLQGTGSMVVNHVISYIAEHYNEGLTLKHVAGVYHISTSYLGQIFKKETGESFTDYANKYRIQKAKELLSNSMLKVYEIAEMVGFTDYHYFLKIFKKIAGVNPTEIRR